MGEGDIFLTSTAFPLLFRLFCSLCMRSAHLIPHTLAHTDTASIVSMNLTQVSLGEIVRDLVDSLLGRELRGQLEGDLHLYRLSFFQNVFTQNILKSFFF